MKKIRNFAIALMVIAGSISSVFAINWKSYPDSFSKKSLAVNAGIGFGNVVSNTTTSIPPIFATADYALPIGGIPFSIGGLIGFTSSSYSYKPVYSSSSYEDDYSVLAIGGRFAYHPNFGVKNLDIYTGIMLGYYIINCSTTGTGIYSDSSATTGDVAWGIYGGARYFFTPNLAAFSELGAGFTYFTLGISYKL